MVADLNFYSNVLGKHVTAKVIYPQQYASHECVSNVDEGRPYKVLVLLHGHGDDYNFWYKRTNVETFIDGKNTVVVMPDGDVSWYCDMFHGRNYFTYITDELLARVRLTFRNVSCDREDTFIGGASMGGYGAMRAAMAFPERFGKAFSFSGALDIDALVPVIGVPNLEDAMGPLDEARQNDSNPFVLAEKLKASGKMLPKLYMWCGFGDFLYDSSVKFRDHLQKIGIPVEYRECEGVHMWPDWNRQLPAVIDWLLE